MSTERPLSAEILVYPLEEIVAEKLRALLQQAAMFEASGSSRARAHDYYDLWLVLGAYRDQMDLAGFDSLLREKCAVRGVSFTGADEFFHDRMLAFVKETWGTAARPPRAGLAYIRDCDQRAAAAGGAAGSSRQRIVRIEEGGRRAADSQGQLHLEDGSAYRQLRPT